MARPCTFSRGLGPKNLTLKNMFANYTVCIYYYVFTLSQFVLTLFSLKLKP